MRKISFIWFLLIIIPINVWANNKVEVTLNKCVDGDTAIFNIDNNPTRVRFLAIDTPESVKPNTEVQKYGKNASEYTCNKLKAAKKIFLEYDDKSDKKDKYDRVLAWIWIDNSLLEKELVEIGYAKVRYIYNDYLYLEELYKAQDSAKEKMLGLWSDYDPIYYKITFNYDENIKEIEVEENDKAEEFIPQKNYYKFLGWYDENNKIFNFETRINKNIILTARYEKDINIIEIMLIIISLLTLISGIRKANNHGRKRKIK